MSKRKRSNPLALVPRNRNPVTLARIQEQATSPRQSPAMLREGRVARTSRTRPARDDRRPSVRAKASYGFDVQAAELRAFIDRSKVQLANHTRAGRNAKADKVAAIIRRAQIRLRDVLLELDAMPVDPAYLEPIQPAKSRVQIKPRTYKRWADK